MPVRAYLSILLGSLAFLVGCADAGGDVQASAVAAGDGSTIVPTAGQEVALDCVAAELYEKLSTFVVAWQTILGDRPPQDTYETEAQFAPRLAAWRQTAAASVDSLATAQRPIVIRRPVEDFGYDADAEVLIVRDFGALVVPGVVVDPQLLLPYPAIHCQTGPFFRCAAHTSQDAWRMDVVRNRVPMTAGPDARIALARETAAAAGLPGSPLEFEAEFALAPAAGQTPPLPMLVLRSVRFVAGDVVVATWEGEPTAAGRTTEQRMVSFVPDDFPPCSESPA